MFEDKTDLLREHIEYLQRLLAEDWRENQELDREELTDELDQYEQDIQDLKDNLPYDEVDEYGEDIEDFSGDELESGELEDEMVEAEEVMEELEALIQQVRDRLDEGGAKDHEPDGVTHLVGCEPNHATRTIINSDAQLDDMLLSWMVDAFKEKNTREGLIETDEVLTRRAMALILAIRNHSDFTSDSPAIRSIAFYMIDFYAMMSGAFPDYVFVFEHHLWRFKTEVLKLYGHY